MIRTTWPSMIFLLCCPCKATAMQVLHFAGNVWIPPPPSWIPYKERVVTLSFTITIIIIIKFWSFNFGRHVIFLNITGVSYPLYNSCVQQAYLWDGCLSCAGMPTLSIPSSCLAHKCFLECLYVYTPHRLTGQVWEVLCTWSQESWILLLFGTTSYSVCFRGRDYSRMHLHVLHVHVLTNVQGRHACGYRTL